MRRRPRTTRPLLAAATILLLLAGCTPGTSPPAQIPEPASTPGAGDPPAPAGELATYAGEYANSFFGPARISADGRALRLELGPTGSWPLEHWSGDEFVFRPGEENALPGSISKATFTGNTLVLEYFDQHGLGTFTQ